MKIGFTHSIFRLGRDEYETLLKKHDELFFRIVSMLIAFMALRGPVNDSPATKLIRSVGFPIDFQASAYFAVAHIIFTFLGALVGAYTSDFRYFEEGAITTGFAMCVMLVLEMYSRDTIDRLGFCALYIVFGLVVLSIVFYACCRCLPDWVTVQRFCSDLYTSVSQSVQRFFSDLYTNVSQSVQQFFSDIYTNVSQYVMNNWRKILCFTAAAIIVFPSLVFALYYIFHHFSTFIHVFGLFAS